MAFLATLLPQTAKAADYGDLSFSNIYHTKIRGEIKLTGNILSYLATANYSQSEINSKSNLDATANNDYNMGYVDVDNDPSTANSSSADLVIAQGAKVDKAFLVWSGTTDPNWGSNNALENAFKQGPLLSSKLPG